MTRPCVLFLNGPNANLYGRDPSGLYGHETFEQLARRCARQAQALGLGLDFRQSNHEGELVDWIQAAIGTSDGLIVNGAGLSYTSVALLDALRAFPGPIIEVHMSNIRRREPFRHRTFIAQAATGTIMGLGAVGYELALVAIGGLIAARGGSG